VSNRQHVSTNQVVIIRSITESYRIAEGCALLYILLTTLFYLFTFYSLVLPICPLVNTNGIPYVCIAFCDSITLCDGPNDDHLIGRNTLSM